LRSIGPDSAIYRALAVRGKREGMIMDLHAAIIAIARYEARQIIKKQLYAKGTKLQSVESSEITIAADQYIEDHPEMIEQAFEQYLSFIKKGQMKPPRKRKLFSTLK
jgi:hypothetical protein